jgi:leader peptidase (prepilin peptidase)/N-methyltransferase
LPWTLPHTSPTEILLLAAWLVLAQPRAVARGHRPSPKRLPTSLLTTTTTTTTVGSLLIAAAVVGDRLALVRDTGVAAVVVGLAYLTLALLAQGQLGIGDGRLAALRGLLLGARRWGTVVGATLPWLLAFVVVSVLPRATRVGRDTQIPFAPYLVAGTLLAAFIGAAG